MLQMCFWHRPSILWLLKPPRMEKHFGPCQQDLNGLSLPLPAASTLHVLILIPDSSRNTVLLLFFFYISPIHEWFTLYPSFSTWGKGLHSTQRRRRLLCFPGRVMQSVLMQSVALQAEIMKQPKLQWMHTRAD